MARRGVFTRTAIPSGSPLARETAQRIERDMDYPGQVQVTVVRETRAVDYAK